jgi:hypothetical protein
MNHEDSHQISEQGATVPKSNHLRKLRPRSAALFAVTLSASMLLSAPRASAADKFCPSVQKLSDALKASDGLEIADSAKAMSAISADMKKVATKAPAKISKSWKALSVMYAKFAVLFAKFDSDNSSAEMTKLGTAGMSNSIVLDAWTKKNCGFSPFE